ncbi:hypothetical protein VCHC51A1_2796, partial [Vibrio cholerae HC-51A1]
MAFAA